MALSPDIKHPTSGASPRPVLGELRGHGALIGLAADREHQEQAAATSLLRLRANPQLKGLIVSRAGWGPADGEAFRIELEPARLVTRGLERDVDKYPLGHACQGGQREHKRLS